MILLLATMLGSALAVAGAEPARDSVSESPATSPEPEWSPSPAGLPSTLPMTADEPSPPSSLPPVAGDEEPSLVQPLPFGHCRGYPVSQPRWFDRAQDYFSRRACTPAIWFDRFFGDERGEDVAGALVRIVPSVQYTDLAETETAVRVRARVRLPRLRDRVSVVLNDDENENAGLLPGEQPRPEQIAATPREYSAALRYLVDLADRSGAEIDVGLRSRLKFFARARYHRSWVHDPVLQTRFTQVFQFRDGDGFSETSTVEVERMLADDLLLRWSTQFTVSEIANGLEAREGILLYRQIDRDRALSWSLATTIRSDPVWQATAYDTGLRYRQRIFRPWFYYEVEPFVHAGRGQHFRPDPGIALRVEMLFGDTGERAARETPREASGTETPAADSMANGATMDATRPVTTPKDVAHPGGP